MARISITTGTRYLLNGTPFIVREVQQGNCFLVEDELFGGQQTLSLQALFDAWKHGTLRFEVPKRHPGTPPETPLPTRYPPPDVTSIPGPLREEALRREDIVLHTLEKQMIRKQITEYVGRIRMQESDTLPGSHQRSKSGYACSASSIARWRKAYIESGYDIRALMPATQRRRRKGRKTFPVEIDTTPLSVLLLDQQHLPLTGSPELTIIVDTGSGYPLEIFASSEPPGYRVMQNALSHVVLPKDTEDEDLETKRSWYADELPKPLVGHHWREVTRKRRTLQQPSAIHLHACPKGARDGEQATSGGSAELSLRETASPEAQKIIQRGRVVQDVACFQNIPGIGTVFFEAVIEPGNHDGFGRFTDLPPTTSSALDLITAVFEWYAQKGSKPLEVWTDSSALYRGDPAHPYERYLTQQGVEHCFWASFPQVKPMTERSFRVAQRFFTSIRGTKWPWTLDRLWAAFEDWIRPAEGSSS